MIALTLLSDNMKMDKSKDTLKDYFKTGKRPTQEHFAELIDSINSPFIGEMKLLSFSKVPKGWAKCNGQLLAINEHSTLFSLIGTNYGGDGINTFALPNNASQNYVIALEGRIPNVLDEVSDEANENYNLGQLTTTEIYNEVDNDGFNEFRFRLFDLQNEVILSSSKRYLSKSSAFDALKNAVNYFLNVPDSLQIKQSSKGKWFFNIVDNSTKILARRIEYFETEQACKEEVLRVKEILKND